ncbi:MAG: TerB family tellurite resistance protein [Methylibium sp.]|uniref:tellurite resistance TerB family protein n=1 Tax=Methylibium sp. TaxID=2067992 RepID=UPI0017F8A4B3|nr:TerB family tellurite resistance protein [Methylibium sp.]MBA2721995.1 TerB family tellurite resistance protein [Methylibium sp.]MBA3599375.1 TerB family tellurite resistance protein [Methylibium sp.]
MLKNLKDLFDSLMPALPAQAPESAEHTLQLATAVLLVEVMRADPDLSAAERQAVIGALQGKFALADDEVARLLELAEQASRDATDYFGFTSKINAEFSMEQKVRMIEHMWRVAYADGQLSAHENHLMRRVSDLLHIPHGAYVGAKMRAKEDAGVD